MDNVLSTYYDLWVSGFHFEGYRAFVETIVFKENSNGSDTLTVTMSDPTFFFSQYEKILIEEATIKFVGGFIGMPKNTFRGYISVIDFSFPESGNPSMVLNCMDQTHAMNRKKKKRSWNNKKYSDVARAIFIEYGFSADITSSGKAQKTISQSNQTDIEFLISMTDKVMDFKCITGVRNGVGYFKKMPLMMTPKITVDYRTNEGKLLSFSPRLNKETKQEEVETSDVDLSTKTVKTSTANSSTPRDLQGK